MKFSTTTFAPGQREHGEAFYLPLTHHEHLVEATNWSVAFDHLLVRCHERGYQPSGSVQIFIRDLFFSRLYKQRLDFEHLEEYLLTQGQVGYRTGTVGQPQSGRQLWF